MENFIRNQRRWVALIALILAALATSRASGRAACLPANMPSPSPDDPVARVLAQQETCPQGAIPFRNMLKGLGARLEPAMVNFVGFHDPRPGAFFIFEIASTAASPPAAVTIERGDLVFGHFTEATGDGRLVSNDSGLQVELIAWDRQKLVYNFYELVDRAWFYRGDSTDILDDIQLLHRKRTASQAPFGSRLRCSGCHVNGGLIQKELVAPHNDWSVRARPLSIGTLKPDLAVKGILDTLIDAGELAKLVAASPQRLADSPTYRKTLSERSMQEQLRPLFCPLEVNLESDAAPFDNREATVQIPAGFFVDRRLADATISIERPAYDAAIKKLATKLPRPAGRADADHAWLTPVKATSDIVAVDALIKQNAITREFAMDVLAVDFTNPVFSKRRCDLLTLVPDEAGSDFSTRFQDRLRGASVPAATELLANLTDPDRDATFHEKQALTYVSSCEKRASDAAAVTDWFRLLAQRRAEVSASEISSHPRNHILEDPVRVVFPSATPPAVPGQLSLTPTCEVR